MEWVGSKTYAETLKQSNIWQTTPTDNQDIVFVIVVIT